MTEALSKIYKKYNLTVINEYNKEKTFTEVLSEIYFTWSKEELLNFFNDILKADLDRELIF